MDATAAKPPTERQLLDLAVQTIRSRVPATWSIEDKKIEDKKLDRSVDAAITFRAPDGRWARLLVYAKTLFNARDVPLLTQLRSQGALFDSRSVAANTPVGGATYLVVTRYLSPRAREALAAADLSYFDATGNVRIRIDDPSIFVETAGSNNDPWRTPDRPTNSLRGRPAARVVRALADMPPPWKVRDLAVAAGTSLGSTARMLDFLDREALIRRDPSGAVIAVEWAPLIERWAADYDLARYPRITRLIEPRGIERVEPAVRNLGLRYVISGSLAARWRAPYAEPRLALIYTDESDRMTEGLGLRGSDVRSNVLIVEPQDDLPFLRSWSEEGNPYAALPQVAVDLLAGPGRNPEEGKALLRWMREFEAQWRIRT
jgi:hypothetical protein